MHVVIRTLTNETFAIAVICLSVGLLVCLFVCEQYNSKTSGWISFKFPYILHIYFSKSSFNFGWPNWPKF